MIIILVIIEFKSEIIRKINFFVSYSYYIYIYIYIARGAATYVPNTNPTSTCNMYMLCCQGELFYMYFFFNLNLWMEFKKNLSSSSECVILCKK
jgi:hypothetical protein